jgi:hypothetical protein
MLLAAGVLIWGFAGRVEGGSLVVEDADFDVSPNGFR